jgi:hypothetical protein
MGSPSIALIREWARKHLSRARLENRQVMGTPVQIYAADGAHVTDEATGLQKSETISPQPRSWADQWGRVQRWHKRFGETAQGRLHDRPSLAYEDEMFAFFESCFHLKDWLKNDPSGPLYRNPTVEEFVNGSEPLRWCADIANGSKHLVANRRARLDPRTGLSRRLIKLEMGNAIPTSISAEYLIAGGGETRDAWQLANACIEAWRQFLFDQHLLPNEPANAQQVESVGG